MPLGEYVYIFIENITCENCNILVRLDTEERLRYIDIIRLTNDGVESLEITWKWNVYTQKVIKITYINMWENDCGKFNVVK